MGHGSGGGEGKASFHDLAFTHQIDKASPVLFQSCTTGTHFKEVNAVITSQGPDGNPVPVLRIKLTDVIISGYTQSSDGGLPVETISLNYQNITYALVAP